jgi:hypothetical protein
MSCKKGRQQVEEEFRVTPKVTPVTPVTPEL